MCTQPQNRRIYATDRISKWICMIFLTIWSKMTELGDTTSLNIEQNAIDIHFEL